jgi:hypothetical protein
MSNVSKDVVFSYTGDLSFDGEGNVTLPADDFNRLLGRDGDACRLRAALDAANAALENERRESSVWQNEYLGRLKKAEADLAAMTAERDAARTEVALIQAAVLLKNDPHQGEAQQSAGEALDAIHREEVHQSRAKINALMIARDAALARVASLTDEAREERGYNSQAWALLTGNDPMGCHEIGAVVTEARRVVARVAEVEAQRDKTDCALRLLYTTVLWAIEEIRGASHGSPLSEQMEDVARQLENESPEWLYPPEKGGE